MADPRRLTDDEARVLRGLEPLPDPQRYGAWVLRGKDVRGMALGAVALGDLLWDDVDFEGVQWSRGALRRAQVQRSRFTDAAFAGCVFEDVLFIECSFTNLQASGVEFRRCRFERCVFASLYGHATVFDQCTFDGTRVVGADIRDAIWQGCALRGCEIEFLRAASTRWSGCAFELGSLRNCRLSYVNTSDLSFERTEFEQVLVVGGEHLRWRIGAAAGSGLKLVSVQLEELRVTGCDGLSDLRLVTSRVHDAQLVGNPLLIGFLIFRSEVTALHVADTKLVQAAFDQANIGPSSVYEGVAFDGFNIVDSQLTRPQFMRCRFSEYFYLHRSELHSLVADALAYDPGLREIHEAVAYPNTAAHLGSRP
jgi:uncharacterized protein YjbI with pentapeptide repeats